MTGVECEAARREFPANDTKERECVTIRMTRLIGNVFSVDAHDCHWIFASFAGGSPLPTGCELPSSSETRESDQVGQFVL